MALFQNKYVQYLGVLVRDKLLFDPVWIMPRIIHNAVQFKQTNLQLNEVVVCHKTNQSKDWKYVIIFQECTLNRCISDVVLFNTHKHPKPKPETSPGSKPCLKPLSYLFFSEIRSHETHQKGRVFTSLWGLKFLFYKNSFSSSTVYRNF